MPELDWRLLSGHLHPKVWVVGVGAEWSLENALLTSIFRNTPHIKYPFLKHWFSDWLLSLSFVPNPQNKTKESKAKQTNKKITKLKTKQNEDETKPNQGQCLGGLFWWELLGPGMLLACVWGNIVQRA